MTIDRKQLTEYVKKAKSGDNEAWSAMFEAIYKDIHYICMEYFKNEDDAQDAEQDTFIKIYQKVGQLEDNESFLAWARKIASNTCYNLCKKHTGDYTVMTFSEVEAEMSTEENDIEFNPEDANITFRPEEQADIKETARLIHDMMAELPDEQRMSLELLYGSELSVKEIAEAMECSENTVKSRLYYGRKAMEGKIEDLRRKGTKLFAIPAVALIRIVCKDQMEAYAAEISGESILQSVIEYTMTPHSVSDYEFDELLDRASSGESLDYKDIHESAVERKKEADKAEKEAKKEAKEQQKAEKEAKKEAEKARKQEVKEESKEQKRAEKEAEREERASEKAHQQEIKEEEKAAKAAKRAETSAERKEAVGQALEKTKAGLSTVGKAVIGVAAAAVVAVTGFFGLNRDRTSEPEQVPETTAAMAYETQNSPSIQETKHSPATAETVAATLEKETAPVHPAIKGECIEVRSFVTSGRRGEEQTEYSQPKTETKQQNNSSVKSQQESETQSQNQTAAASAASSANQLDYSYTFGYADDDGGARLYIADHELSASEIAALEAEFGKPLTVTNISNSH